MINQQLTEICSKYKVLLIDLNGVIHNGIKLYSGRMDWLQQMAAEGKTIILFSNAPQTHANIIKHLSSMGLDLNTVPNTQLHTSGQYFLDKALVGELEFSVDRKTFAAIGDLNSSSLVAELLVNGWIHTSDFKNADFVLLLARSFDPSEVYQYEALLQRAIQAKLPAVSPNPDMIAVYGDSYAYPQGMLAARYQNLGGKVYYYGKPNINFYEHACYNLIAEGVHKEEILAIGDSLATDITGACAYGIDSLLLLSGIYRGVSNPSQLLGHYLDNNIAPTYIKSQI